MRRKSARPPTLLLIRLSEIEQRQMRCEGDRLPASIYAYTQKAVGMKWERERETPRVTSSLRGWKEISARLKRYRARKHSATTVADRVMGIMYESGADWGTCTKKVRMGSFHREKLQRRVFCRKKLQRSQETQSKLDLSTIRRLFVTFYVTYIDC